MREKNSSLFTKRGDHNDTQDWNKKNNKEQRQYETPRSNNQKA